MGICNKTYKEQAVWFLKLFWEDFAEKEAELLWQYVLKNAELDLENHEEGCGLDEMKAHVFLEKFDETLTVREMRAKLRSTGAIGETERPKNVPLTHYLLYKYNADWNKLVDETRQGDNAEEIEKAEAMLAEVTAAFKESEARAADARNALNAAVSAENSAKAREDEAVSRENAAVEKENAAVASENAAVARENEAKASEAEAKTREASAKQSHAESQEKEAVAKKDAAASVEREQEAKAAQDELEAALAEVKAQEDAYNSKTEELKKKSETGGVVSRNKAANELAQHLAEDPLPLRRAKITAEAAVKRAEKTRAPFEAATKEAEAARQIADKALADARAKVQEAENYLKEVKSRPGQPYGALWWIDRELHEAKAYVPESKGGYRKK